MNAIRPVVVLLVTLLSAAVGAQELDIFEVSDFVDPRLRGAKFNDEGTAATEPGADYFIIRAVAGGAANYSWRTVPSDANVAFFHVSSSYYRGLNQLNLKLTRVQSASDSSLPHWRATAQLAHYVLARNTRSAVSDVAGRYLVTTSIEENRLCRGIGRAVNTERCSRHFDTEIGLQVDSRFILPLTQYTATGSMIFSWRDSAADGQVYRSTYTGRWYKPLGKRTRLTLWYELNGEYAQSLHMGATRLGASTTFDVGKDFSAHVVWMPSYVPNQPGRRVYNELAIFFDRKLFSRLTERLPRTPLMGN